MAESRSGFGASSVDAGDSEAPIHDSSLSKVLQDEPADEILQRQAKEERDSVIAGQRAKEFELEESTRGSTDRESDFALKSAINAESIEDSLHSVEAVSTAPPEPVY